MKMNKIPLTISNTREMERRQSHNPEVPSLEYDDLPSTCSEPTLVSHVPDSTESKPSFNQNDIVKALEVVDRDSIATAESFSPLRLALSEYLMQQQRGTNV